MEEKEMEEMEIQTSSLTPSKQLTVVTGEMVMEVMEVMEDMEIQTSSPTQFKQLTVETEEMVDKGEKVRMEDKEEVVVTVVTTTPIMHHTHPYKKQTEEVMGVHSVPMFPRVQVATPLAYHTQSRPLIVEMVWGLMVLMARLVPVLLGLRVRSVPVLLGLGVHVGQVLGGPGVHAAQAVI